ncbi:TetR/AcrR family transcriptional regulator [Microbacterium sp. NPDC019599]|uniref:TetR/AcrR family transcriptional regulator n=1 Tax=Microbacterium sp. NPDC019599 TaxID=3154690 RepID=UPI0033FA4492
MEQISPAGSARDALLRAANEELIEKGHAAVSLRAVARRAGVSHAAPAHFFGDRAGMLTAVATEGFAALSRALEDAARHATDSGRPVLEALGRGYVDFGLEHPALMELMFRRSELNPDDAGLIEAQRSALGCIRAAVADLAGADADPDAEEWSLVSWAVVHGLVSLVHEGVLARVSENDPDAAADLARRLVAVYGEGLASIARR